MQEILLATARRLVGARREAGRGARRGKRWRMAPREEEEAIGIGSSSSRARARMEWRYVIPSLMANGTSVRWSGVE
jgi:hypothetical protein